MTTLQPLRKITLILVLIAAFPAAFLIYELNALNKDEVIIKDIYRNQLDAILFSVNQYSDDLVGSWANRLSVVLQTSDTLSTEILATGLKDVNSIAAVFLADSSGKSATHLFHEEDEHIPFESMIKGIIRSEPERINKLLSYYDAGFRKLESMDTLLEKNFVPIFFVLDENDKDYKLAAMILDIPAFVQNSLGPKMQSIAEEKFVINVVKRQNSEAVYTTLAEHPSSRRQINNEFTRNLWILPHYLLGISMREATLDDVARERTRNDIILLAFLMIILVMAIILLYRNVRSEIKLSQAKTEFVSNVSHEIRTPLSLISMYAETLEMNRVSEEKKRDYYTIISKEAARLTGIVNRVLNFSKAEANKKEYTMALIDLNELCAEVVDSYRPIMNDNGFQFVFVPHDDLELINGDWSAIEEAIINLLDNAMKYSRERKEIVLRTGIEKNLCYVDVQDHGIGIPRAYQKDIFEQFYRAPMGNVHNTKGSGLGLALVRKTMEAHKGLVKVESALDKGSTFRLYFPFLTSKAV